MKRSFYPQAPDQWAPKRPRPFTQQPPPPPASSSSFYAPPQPPSAYPPHRPPQQPPAPPSSAVYSAQPQPYSGGAPSHFTPGASSAHGQVRPMSGPSGPAVHGRPQHTHGYPPPPPSGPQQMWNRNPPHQPHSQHQPPSSYQHFQQQGSAGAQPPSNTRTIYIGGFDDQTTVEEIMDLVRGGLIEVINGVKI